MCNAEKMVEMLRRIKAIQGIASNSSKGSASIEVPEDWPLPNTDNVDLATLSAPPLQYVEDSGRC
jgi:hypothetical protein